MFTFLNNGIKNYGSIYSKNNCKKLLREIHKNRDFKKIFLSKKEFLKGNGSNLKLNPSPGNNLLHKINSSFIFENAFLQMR